jgi:aminoglycoside phosphotransferase family enzyme/predicted kinase
MTRCRAFADGDEMHRARSKIARVDTALIEKLMDPGAFDEPPAKIEKIETHISWVILTDRFAYKIKKPLLLDFLDFGTLERRRFYCDEEIRLNRPWAPDIYLDVVAITDDGGRLRFGGDGKPVEYAVRMHRFDENLRLDRQRNAGKLSAEDMRELGQAIAARHGAAPIADVATRERTLHMTSAQIRDNFGPLQGQIDADTLASLQEWTEAELQSNAGLIERRFDAGFFRDCHGDLHLANLVRMPGGIRSFDCIEFSADLRRIDVICDTAFLVMDLVATGRSDLAALFLNRYLECCGDYAGVAQLDLYFVYRSMVRAKVAVICSQECELQNERLKNLVEAGRYCRIALRQTRKPAPLLVIMSGLSGSGKTWVSGQLMARLPAIRIRSNIERKRLFRLPEVASSASGIAAGIYSPGSSHDVYQHLFRTALSLLQTRHNVILDASFLLREHRDAALELADRSNYAAVIVDVRAPQLLMRERIQERGAMAADASEGGADVLDHQLATAEEFTAQQRARTTVFENIAGSEVGDLLDLLQGRAGTA